MRTLLADDNVEIRAALRLLLEELGERDILEAGDLGQALAALGRYRANTAGAVGARILKRGTFVSLGVFTSFSVRLLVMRLSPNRPVPFARHNGLR
jgi:CheY-like chemotaxis protein